MHTCPKCDSDQPMEIVINLTDGDSVRFLQCRACDGKWWERDGAPIALDEVLNLTSRSEQA